MTHLRQERLTREQKMARERAQLEGAHEVRYRERAFRPRHHDSLEEVRAAVDSLAVERRPLPTPAPVPAAPAPAPPPIDPARRAALAPVVPGALVAVASRYRTGEGEVVEATYEQDGARRSGLYLLAGGAARPVDDVEARIDALPEPTRARPVETPIMPRPVELPPPAPEPKKKGFGLKLGKGKDAAPAASPPAEPAASPEAPKKKGFGLKLGRDKTPPAPATTEEAAPAESTGEKAPKKRFGFGKK